MILKTPRTPVVFLGVLLLVDALAYLQLTPTKSAIFLFLSEWLAGAGLPTVFFISLIENIPLANVYFPGSIAILASMAGAAGDIPRIVLVWAVVSCGALLGQLLIFVMGARISRFLRKNDVTAKSANEVDQRNLFLLGLTSFWHPHLASMACLAMIDLGVGFRRFATVSIFWTCTWNILWTFFVLSFGNIFSEGSLGFLLVYLFLIAWILISILQSNSK